MFASSEGSTSSGAHVLLSYWSSCLHHELSFISFAFPGRAFGSGDIVIALPAGLRQPTAEWFRTAGWYGVGQLCMLMQFLGSQAPTLWPGTWAPWTTATTTSSRIWPGETCSTSWKPRAVVRPGHCAGAVGCLCIYSPLHWRKGSLPLETPPLTLDCGVEGDVLGLSSTSLSF